MILCHFYHKPTLRSVFLEILIEAKIFPIIVKDRKSVLRVVAIIDFAIIDFAGTVAG